MKVKNLVNLFIWFPEKNTTFPFGAKPVAMDKLQTWNRQHWATKLQFHQKHLARDDFDHVIRIKSKFALADQSKDTLPVSTLNGSTAMDSPALTSYKSTTKELGFIIRISLRGHVMTHITIFWCLEILIDIDNIYSHSYFVNQLVRTPERLE